MSKHDSTVTPDDRKALSKDVINGYFNHLITRRSLGGLALGLGVSATALSKVSAQQDTTPEPGPAVPPEYEAGTGNWPSYQGNLEGTRAASGSQIDSASVLTLERAWTYTTDTSGFFGAFTANPIVIGDAVYLQEGAGTVIKFQRETGEILWKREYDAPTVGPGGICAGYGMIFGTLATKATAFALDAETGEELWSVPLAGALNEGAYCAPSVYNNILYVGTTGGYFGPANNGVWALNAQTGEVLWFFDTVDGNDWGNPSQNHGAGVWYPPTFDDEGSIFFGTGNPGPWPPSEAIPNAEGRPGDNLYSSSMVSLNGATGEIEWYIQAHGKDIFDHDFQNSPIIADIDHNGTPQRVAIGSGKRGTVIVADARTGDMIWQVPVGIHNATSYMDEIPEGEEHELYPGPAGGAQTPIAYDADTIYVPLHNYSAIVTATTSEFPGGYETGKGALWAVNVFNGDVKWTVDFPTMMTAGATVSNDLVFVGGLDGLFRAMDANTGELIWRDQLPSGINASPAISGDMIFLPAGGPLMLPSEGAENDMDAMPERGNLFVAYRIAGSASATPESEG